VARSPEAGRVGVAKAAFALVVPYALVGAGIGAACGSVYLGLLVGVVTGLCAAGAILLISGASLTAEALNLSLPVERVAVATAGGCRPATRRSPRSPPPIRIGG